MMLGVGKRTLAGLLVGTVALAACKSDDPAAPSNNPPTGVTATSLGATSVHLAWTAAASVTGYILERAEGSTGGSYVEVNRPAATATSYDDTGLNPATVYRYRLAAVRTAGTSPFATEVLVTTSAPAVVNITADITTNTTWTSTSVYKIVGFRKVANNSTLTIEAGTRIIGDFATVGSSLFVLRGSRIIANGTATAPIVFTSAQAEGAQLPGDWGGLIIIGNGIINRSGTVNIEGTGTSTENPLIPYSGGNNNADNSGTLRYVRVEWAGFAPATDAELNSFTFAAVGSGTTLDFLQAVNGFDDAFEFFGGAVDAKHLVSYETGDDHFDMSEGYVGRLQYLIGFQSYIQNNRPGVGGVSSDPQGIENDGCNGSGCDLAFNSTPFTVPVVANFTLVGPGAAGPAGGGFGMVLRRGTAGHYVNGIWARYLNAGIGYRDADTKARETAGILTIRNNLIAQTPLALQAGQQAYDIGANAVILEQATTAASLFTKLPTTVRASPGVAGTTAADFDWSLSAASPARTGGLATFTGDLLTRAGAFVAGTAYRGAADPAAAKWWEGWTYYLRNQL
ncbi:MAG: fibronectin type III domain-containing protein [Gemmatimonadales bacterium]|nr:fibronectin type III domain-containing protein [Gemmatimonadales bacterium]